MSKNTYGWRMVFFIWLNNKVVITDFNGNTGGVWTGNSKKVEPDRLIYFFYR